MSVAVPDIGAKRGIRDLVDCPLCGGRGQDVSPRFQRQDGKCEFCHGYGKVSLVACPCGRPKRFDKIGWVEKGIYSCGLEECKRILKPRIMMVALALPVHEVYGLQDKDSKEAEEVWQQYMGRDVWD